MANLFWGWRTTSSLCICVWLPLSKHADSSPPWNCFSFRYQWKHNSLTCPLPLAFCPGSLLSSLHLMRVHQALVIDFSFSFCLLSQDNLIETLNSNSRLIKGFPSGSAVKEFTCNAGDVSWSLGGEDPLEKEMATHSSILA